MSRKPPEKRIYNIQLYLNYRLLFKSFTSESAPKEIYSYRLNDDRCLNRELNPDSMTIETIDLIFGNYWYNQAKDTFEYFLINID